MSFLHPRTVSVSRPNAVAPIAAGVLPYSGETQGGSGETEVLSCLPANITQARARSSGMVDIPASSDSVAYWISIPARAGVKNGDILTRDIIVDDLGVRYQVASPNWNSMGFRVYAEMLQA